MSSPTKTLEILPVSGSPKSQKLALRLPSDPESNFPRTSKAMRSDIRALGGQDLRQLFGRTAKIHREMLKRKLAGRTFVNLPAAWFL